MRYLCALALLLMSGIVSATVARADVPPGWGSAADFPKALEVAKRNGQAIAVVFTFDRPRSQFEVPDSDFEIYIMQDPGLAQTLKLLINDGQTPKFLAKIEAQIGGARGGYTRLYLLDQNGNPSGFVRDEDWLNVPKAISIANQVAQWIKKSDRQIAIAEKGAAVGRYDEALKVFAKIEKQDHQVTAAVGQVLPLHDEETSTADSSERKSGKPAPTAAESNAARAGASIFDKPDASSAKADKPDAPDADLPKGRYYPDLVATKRAIYEAQAEDRVTQARAEFGQNHYVAARRLLNAMVLDHADFDAVKEAADLLKTIEAAEEDARKQAPAKPN